MTDGETYTISTKAICRQVLWMCYNQVRERQGDAYRDDIDKEVGIQGVAVKTIKDNL